MKRSTEPKKLTPAQIQEEGQQLLEKHFREHLGPEVGEGLEIMVEVKPKKAKGKKK